VRRFQCSSCHKTFTCLPDILLPFKHYVAGEIEGVLRHLLGGGKLSEAPSGADDSTLRRWWEEFRHKLPQWAGALESLAYRMFSHSPSLIRHCDPLRRLEEALSRLPSLPSRCAVMVRALWWLERAHQLRLPRPP